MDGRVRHDLMAQMRALAMNARSGQCRPPHGACACHRAANFAATDARAEESSSRSPLLRVWKKAPRWRPKRRFRTFSNQGVVNFCASREPACRASRSADSRSAASRPIPAPVPAPCSMLASRYRALSTARIDSGVLPGADRAAIVLTYQEGLGNAEAAPSSDNFFFRSGSASRGAPSARSRMHSKEAIMTDDDRILDAALRLLMLAETPRAGTRRAHSRVQLRVHVACRRSAPSRGGPPH